MLIETLRHLERLRSMDEAMLGRQLGQWRMPLLDKGWIAPVGYLSHDDVEVREDVFLEAELSIDEAAGRYAYAHPFHPRVTLTGPLFEVTRYRFQRDVLFDDLAALLEIPPRFSSRRRTLLDDHLWYLGDTRIGTSHAVAPVFFGRLLKRADPEAVSAALADPVFATGGVVLALRAPKLALPNAHQVRAMADLLIVEDGVESLDRAMLERILAGLPSDPADEPDEWFDAKNGYLKLRHLEAPVKFEGIQSKIIEIFWKARDGAPLAWTSDIKERAGSVAHTLDKAMGGKKRRERFIKTVSRGRYRLRRD